jgi:hypothetical protein
MPMLAQVVGKDLTILIEELFIKFGQPVITHLMDLCTGQT